MTAAPGTDRDDTSLLRPAWLLLAVAAIDLGLDTERPTVTALTSLAPLLAATTLTTRIVRVYAAAAMLMTVVLGLYYELLGLTSALDVPQLTRYAAVAAVGMLAVRAGRARERREQDLLQVTGIAARSQAILPPLPDRSETSGSPGPTAAPLGARSSAATCTTWCRHPGVCD